MNQEAINILDQHHIGVLATIGDDGSPQATPVHVFRDGDTVFWLSSETARHSLNLVRDSRVSLSVFSPDTSAGLRGVYVQGMATKLESRDDVLKIVETRLGMVPKPFLGYTAYSLPIGVLDEQRSFGNCWYFYT